MMITPQDFVAGSGCVVLLFFGYIFKTAWLGSSDPNDDADIEVLIVTKTQYVVMARNANKEAVAYHQKGSQCGYDQARRSRIRHMREARRVDLIIRKIRAERPFPKTKIDA